MQNKIHLQCIYKKNVEESITTENTMKTSNVVDLSCIAERVIIHPKHINIKGPD